MAATDGRVSRSYQDYIYRRAIERNVIACLPTGSGKTFIACLLIRHFAHELEAPFSQSGKRIFFLVPQKVLVKQQADEIRNNTPFKEHVAELSGDNDVDGWTNEKWTSILTKYKIFVMIHDVFKQLLSRGNVLPLKQVSLIVFDEAHHAAMKAKMKQSDHSYRQILRTLAEKRAPVRLLGLTASIINNRIPDSKLEAYVKDLEMAFLDAECVIVDSEEVFRHQTNARIVMWLTEPCHESPERLQNLCQWLSQQLKQRHEIWKKTRTWYPVDCDDVSRMMARLSKFLSESSFWICRQLCIEYEAELQLLLANYHTFSPLLNGVMGIISPFREKLSLLLESLSEKDQIIGTSSSKLVRLLQLLENYCHISESFRCIIFVQTRLEAKAICAWLQRVAGIVPSLSFLKAQFLTGYSSRPGFVDTVTRLSRKLQRKTMDEFKSGSVNLLVATSVLEEGLDVTECNCVIRYNLPDTYRSFQQSMGRARAKNAHFFLLTEVGEQEAKMRRDLDDFRAVAKTLADVCANDYERRKELCGLSAGQLDESEELWMTEQLVREKVVNPETGAEITAESAVSRVFEYLAQSSLGWIPRPEDTFVSFPDGYCCQVRLPICSGIAEVVCGSKMSSRLHARKSAYLRICSKLMLLNRLDQHLRPAARNVIVSRIIKSLSLEVPPQKVVVDGQIPGTKKRKQNYPKYLLPVTADSSSPRHMYRVVMRDRQLPESIHCLSLLSPVIFPPEALCSFELYRTNRSVEVSLLPLSSPMKPLTEESEALVQWFHKFVFTQMLDVTEGTEFVSGGCLVAPITLASGEIDFTYIHSLKQRDEHRADVMWDEDGFGVGRTSAFVFREVDYVDAVVRRWYRSHENNVPIRGLQSWTRGRKVEAIENSLQSLMPQSKCTFADHFENTYGLKSTDTTQKLLRVIPGAQAAALTPIIRSRVLRLEYWVPEYCEICPLSGSMWDQIVCLPALFHRLNQLQMAFERRIMFKNVIGLEIDAGHPFDRLEFFRSQVRVHAQHTDDDTSLSPSSDFDSEDSDEEKIDNSDQCPPSQMDVQAAGDFVCQPLTALKVVCNNIRANIAKSAPTIIFNPNEKILFHMFESQIPASTRPSVTISAQAVSAIEALCTQQIEQLEAFFSSDSRLTGTRFGMGEEVLTAKCLLTSDESAFRVVRSFESVPDGLTFPPGLDIEVLTAKSAADVVNSERLETLGDAFLKYSVSIYLHARISQHMNDSVVSSDFFSLTEGHMTEIKGHLVSNYNLCRKAEEKEWPKYMFVQRFEPKVNWLAPCFQQIAHQKFDRTMQTINDKAVADSVEAMIGAIVLQLGQLQAIRFMSWLGLPVLPSDKSLTGHWLPVVDPVPVSLLQEEKDTLDLKQKFFFGRSNLSLMEKVLNYKFRNKWFAICAVTHSSCFDNYYTGSYERLEFVGDAVLDYLIACFCFECQRVDGSRLDPGEMTDLRSALVNNAFLGSLLVKHDLHNCIFLMAHELRNQISACAEKLRTLDDQSAITIGSYVVLKNADSECQIRPTEVPKILGDVMEALIGAVYLDSGRSLDAVWRIVYGFMQTELNSFVQNVPKNPIRRLYELDSKHKFYGGKQTGVASYVITLRFKGKDYIGKGRNRHFARIDAALSALYQ